MYVPAHYRGSPAAAVTLVRASPLATLLSSADPVPYATHLPAVIPEATADALRSGPVDLNGHRLAGHMNRANPHWRHIADGETPALLIFRGPNGYVSPEVYDYSPAAPTWNFTAVHVRGTLRPLPAGEATRTVVRRTVQELEGRFGFGWDMTDSLEYFDRIISAVGAFEVEVEQVDGMFKLSQEQSDGVRTKVTRHFSECPHTGYRDLAHAMEQFGKAGNQNVGETL
ncbi:transcriptional regulator [Streptomyces sp. V3I8]|uniref:FMN-binding negative transcriptional regulator n=1 Tax=Streptomyces sp. V3I8 TaxID=3042279 RepID=UPI0027824E93|nr:FMN-binding negative transcriptional regulator [Streptomyces sp. V3I8]MDQ1034633.1 transcriptional regulator [Streptomyces sp. V3I8]